MTQTAKIKPTVGGDFIIREQDNQIGYTRDSYTWTVTYTSLVTLPAGYPIKAAGVPCIAAGVGEASSAIGYLVNPVVCEPGTVVKLCVLVRGHNIIDISQLPNTTNGGTLYNATGTPVAAPTEGNYATRIVALGMTPWPEPASRTEQTN